MRNEMKEVHISEMSNEDFIRWHEQQEIARYGKVKLKFVKNPFREENKVSDSFMTNIACATDNPIKVAKKVSNGYLDLSKMVSKILEKD